MSIDQDYIKELNLFLEDDDDSIEEEVFEEKGIEGNVKVDDVRATDQALLYIVVDKSGSMYNYGLEEAVKKGLSDVKDVVNGSKESKYIQTAMTFFGSELDMRPFKYGENIDITYKADGSATRLYDAIVESGRNMISQYEALRSECKVKGVMFIFTDGDENASRDNNLESAKRMLQYELMEKRGITVLLAGFKSDNFDLTGLGSDLGLEPIEIKDPHKLRRLMKFVSLKAAN